MNCRFAGSNPTLDNLNSRIKAWWWMVALIGLAFAFGRTVIVMSALTGIPYRRIVTLIWDPLITAFATANLFIVLPLQYFLVWIEWYGLYSIFIPVYGFLVMPIVAAIGEDTKRFLERTAKVQWGLMMCVYCISHVPALLTLEIPGFEGRNLLRLSAAILISDVLQYVWGKLLGRRPIAPQLSPSKTVEGFVGGVASATLLGALLWWITPFTLWQAGAIALLINLMGFFGGLVMSAIKRDRGVKDWGWLIEGHGGVIDRLDSVIFAAPVFFHVTRYFWAV